MKSFLFVILSFLFSRIIAKFESKHTQKKHEIYCVIHDIMNCEEEGSLHLILARNLSLLTEELVQLRIKILILERRRLMFKIKLGI